MRAAELKINNLSSSFRELKSESLKSLLKTKYFNKLVYYEIIH